MEIVIALLILIIGIMAAINLSKQKKVYEGEYCVPKSSEKVEFGSVYFIKDGNCVVQECVEEYIPENNKCVFDCSSYDTIKSTSNIFIQKACFEECFNSEGSLLEEKDVFKYDLDVCGFVTEDEEKDEEPEYQKSLMDEILDVTFDGLTLKGSIPASTLGKTEVGVNHKHTFTPTSNPWSYTLPEYDGIVHIEYTTDTEVVDRVININS